MVLLILEELFPERDTWAWWVSVLPLGTGDTWEVAMLSLLTLGPLNVYDI